MHTCGSAVNAFVHGGAYDNLAICQDHVEHAERDCYAHLRSAHQPVDKHTVLHHFAGCLVSLGRGHSTSRTMWVHLTDSSSSWKITFLLPHMSLNGDI